MERKFVKNMVVRPQDLNHAGTLFGGVMMAWADEMAFIAATLTHPGCAFVTKVFHEFNFVSGAVAGDIIEIEARVMKTGRTSVLVSVKAANAINCREIFHTKAVMVNARDGKSVEISGVKS